MNTAGAEAPQNFFSRMLGWIATAWEQASEADVVAGLDSETIRLIARDCGIEPDQLVALAKAGPHAADEMIEMMKALNIDPTEVQLRYQAEFREMQLTCARCGAKGQCRRDLADGSAPAEFQHYCANAEQLTALHAEPDVLLQ